MADDRLPPITVMAKRRKPPPKTEAGGSVSKPVKHCSVQPQEPCDVNKLVVDILAKDDNFTEERKGLQPGKRKDVKRRIEMTATRLHEPVTDVKDPEVLRMLGYIDAIVETIADYPAKDDPKLDAARADEDDVVTLRLVRAHYQGNCGDQLHPALGVIPMDPMRELKESICFSKPGTNEIVYHGPSKFYAPSVHFDSLPIGQSYFAVFEIILALFTATKPKAVWIQAWACGTRAPSDRKRPNRNISCLLRIYRRDSWAIGVKIPPLGQFTEERKAERFKDLWRDAPKGDYQRSREYGTGTSYGLQSKSTIERRGQETTRADEIWVAGRGGREESSTQGFKGPMGKSNRPRRSPAETIGLVHERLEASSGFEIFIARNDREVDLVELFGKTKKIVGKTKKIVDEIEDAVDEIEDVGDIIDIIKTSIDNLARAITAIKNFFRKLPQFGWKFTFEISLFAGTLSLTWGPSYAEKVLANGRYYPVNYEFRGRISMEIISLKVALSFGVDAQALDSGLVLKVEGSIELKVAIEHDINMDLLKPKEKFDLDAEGKPDLRVVGYISLLGYTLTGAELGVTTAIELKGYMEIDWRNKEFGIKGVLSRKPIMLYGSIQGLFWSSEIDPPIELMEGGDLYTFK